ncbi:hypothetical protein JCM10449v2_004851 [Rhodotorula kratochvilovae]
MASSSPSKSATATASLDVVLQWNLDLDLSDTSLTGIYPIQEVALPGDWALKIGATAEAVTFTVQHGNVPDETFGHDIVRSFHLYWLGGFLSSPLDSSEATVECMPQGGSESFSTHLNRDTLNRVATASAGTFLPASHRKYRVKAQLLVKKPLVRSTASAPETLVQRLRAVNLTPLPHDVRLFFPLVGAKGAELWTSSTLLSSSSPYLETLLESDFAESVSKRIKGEQDEAAESVALRETTTTTKNYEDSDDESDALTSRTRAPRVHDPKSGPDFPFRQINIVDTAYTTYRAVLLYLQTHHIAFAPLSSVCAPLDPSAPMTRLERLSSSADLDPSAPFPVSPKSAYRLAHLLELSDLEERCLHALRRSLTVASAPHELFDDASVCFPGWRGVVLKFVLRNWDAVTASESWRSLDERIERDEIRGAGPILREVMKAKLFTSKA